MVKFKRKNRVIPPGVLWLWMTGISMKNTENYSSITTLLNFIKVTPLLKIKRISFNVMPIISTLSYKCMSILLRKYLIINTEICGTWFKKNAPDKHLIILSRMPRDWYLIMVTIFPKVCSQTPNGLYSIKMSITLRIWFHNFMELIIHNRMKLRTWLHNFMFLLI